MPPALPPCRPKPMERPGTASPRWLPRQGRAALFLGSFPVINSAFPALPGPGPRGPETTRGAGKREPGKGKENIPRKPRIPTAPAAFLQESSAPGSCQTGPDTFPQRPASSGAGTFPSLGLLWNHRSGDGLGWSDLKSQPSSRAKLPGSPGECQRGKTFPRFSSGTWIAGKGSRGCCFPGQRHCRTRRKLLGARGWLFLGIYP